MTNAGREGRLHVGVDVGGTFTDIVVVAPDGEVQTTKVPTQPHVFAALTDGLDQLGVALGDVELIVHGTTVATNALVQRRGARTVLVATEGFRDLLEIRRTNKGDVYDLNWSPPPPIVSRPDRLEAVERTAWTGEVLRELDEQSAAALLEEIGVREPEAVAIALLHAYANPDHERRLRELIRAAHPEVHISISSDVAPSYREFERTSTTVANAYVAPVVERYVDRLDDELAASGAARSSLIMQSNGGVTSVATCKEIPAKTLQSGPAGGTVALAAEARRSGHPHLIGLDMGGTTTDVSMVWDGTPRWRPELTVEFGLPIVFPTIDIVSIGAGGGTIASVDRGGALRVGPESAGADPGPACYGAGGELPTGTDAQLVLGRVASGTFLGGRMQLDRELAERAIATHVAQPLGISVEEAASGIVDILTNNMIQAVRLVTIERGFDPRDFALCGFGGGGSLYAADIAADLSMPHVLVPRLPGVLSALGVLSADVVHDAARTLLASVGGTAPADVEAQFAALEATVMGQFAHEQTAREDVELQRFADLLYEGQTHSLSIEVEPGAFDERRREHMVAAFHADHRRRFGHADAALAVEYVNLRVFGRRLRAARELRYAEAGAKRTNEPLGTRPVSFRAAGGFTETPVYDRANLAPGAVVDGPAIVEQMDATTVVPPGVRATVQPDANLLLAATETTSTPMPGRPA